MVLLLLTASLLVAGCGKTVKQQEQKKEPVKQEQENTEIPSDLLPSGEQEETSAEQSADEKVSDGQKENNQSKTAQVKKPDKSKEDMQVPDKTAEQKNTIQVKISISCKEAAKEGYTGPTTLLPTTTLTLEKGATVYDALKATGVAFSGAGGYVAGISGVYEFDWGSTSGWLYYVNGIKPNVASTKYVCKDGDVIQWRYTTK